VRDKKEGNSHKDAETQSIAGKKSITLPNETSVGSIWKLDGKCLLVLGVSAREKEEVKTLAEPQSIAGRDNLFSGIRCKNHNSSRVELCGKEKH
jgi:hypothetical protein